MEWFKKHADTFVILGAVCGSLIWMNGKFAQIDKDFAQIDKDMAIIKTVLIMKQILPPDIISKVQHDIAKSNE